MRVLATIALSFTAGCLAAVVLPWDGWLLWAAGALLCAGIAVLLLKRKLAGKKYLHLRLLLILFSMAASLLYTAAYQRVIVAPLADNYGEVLPFEGTVVDYPVATNSGAKVMISIGFGQKAVYYGDETLLTLQPGQKLRGSAYWQNAMHIRDDAITTFSSRGVYVLLYDRSDVTAEQGSAGSLLWLPQRAARAVQEQVRKIWRDDTTAGFVSAILTGDRTGLTIEDETAMSEAGLSHLFAVSGLHCTFLVTLLGLLIRPGRRRLFAACAIASLFFYMLMAGLSPSIVRSCIMLSFVLTAPLVRRDSDGLTSLSAALLVILLCNPYAAASISLQLSFAATMGILLCGGRLYRFFMKLEVEQALLRRLWSFLAANVSASLGALVFTIPLTAWYFNIFTLLSPLSNLLVVPAASWTFVASFLTVLLGFVWLPGAQFVGWVVWALVYYALWIARMVMAVPGHALYLSNRYLKYWLGYVYAMFGVCCFSRGRRKYVLSGVLAALTLMLTVWLGGAEYRYGSLGVLTLDVGQGESVLLYSEEAAVLVDCGSSNTYIDAGQVAADQIATMGFDRLSAIVVTHYHADHTNGLYELMARVPADRLYLPRIEDEYGVRDRLEALAERYGMDVVYVEREGSYPMGQASLRLYPPLGEGDLNEQGLTVLCSAGDYDVLITGDMAGSTEKKLIEQYPLPDIELLVVSHHGSKHSSTTEFLETLQPETAVISVGDNSYGHPSNEALLRLVAAGCEIYRTDLQGNVLLTVKGEESWQAKTK